MNEEGAWQHCSEESDSSNAAATTAAAVSANFSFNQSVRPGVSAQCSGDAAYDVEEEVEFEIEDQWAADARSESITGDESEADSHRHDYVCEEADAEGVPTGPRSRTRPPPPN